MNIRHGLIKPVWTLAAALVAVCSIGLSFAVPGSGQASNTTGNPSGQKSLRKPEAYYTRGINPHMFDGMPIEEPKSISPPLPSPQLSKPKANPNAIAASG